MGRADESAKCGNLAERVTRDEETTACHPCPERPAPPLSANHIDHNHNNNEKAGHVAPPGMLSLKTSIYPTRHVAESSDCLRRRRVVQEQLQHDSTAAHHRFNHGV